MDADVTRSLDLVQRAQAGDAAALDALCARYYERVRKVVRARLGAALRRRVDSADILQETFLEAVRSFERFEVRDEASLIKWLATLAERQVYAAADRHGAAKRDARREQRLVAPGASGTIGVDPTANVTLPVERAAADEQAALLEAALDELTAEHRDLIVMRLYVGESWASIAEQTGRPSSDAARMMHAQALVELGKVLRRRQAPG